MKATCLLLTGLAAAMIATSAQADVPQRHSPRYQPVPSAQQSLVSPPVTPAPTQAAPKQLFRIGELPVRLWAPVPPPYDGRSNRNSAANPLWWNGAMM